MGVAAGLFAVALILITVWDMFETVVMPRTILTRLRLTTLFYRYGWRMWKAATVGLGARRERFLSVFGPMSLIILLGTWALTLMVAFAILHWAVGANFVSPNDPPDFWTCLYLSGTTLFTLGMGDVAPLGAIARSITVFEAGLGLALLAVVIGYLPVLYQAFSRREVTISLLDARAGSPPTASELLRRHGVSGNAARVPELLRVFELWSAEVLESHLSYPVLAFYRSQHDRESWLSSLTTILDTSALVAVGVGDLPTWQANLTLAMGRHTVVDLALVFGTGPAPASTNRLPPEGFAQLRDVLAGAGLPLRDGDGVEERLARLRLMYEPYVQALADHLVLELPPWIGVTGAADNWQTSAWEGGHL